MHRRVMVLHAALLFCTLIVVARLIELQVVHGAKYSADAEQQHFGGVKLPAKRGDILGVDSKTGEHNIFATNTTLDMVYVDPSTTDDPQFVAQTLADILITDQFHADCSAGKETCPRELIPLYAAAYDPLTLVKLRDSGALLEPLPPGDTLPPQLLHLPTLLQARDTFAQAIRQRIADKRVTFSPLKYGATKVEMQAVSALNIPGITVDESQGLVAANPEEINQSLADAFGEKLASILRMDPDSLTQMLRARELRYVPIMHRLPPEVSLRLLEAKTESAKEALDKAKQDAKKDQAGLHYPLESIALLPEHWRFYPDTTIASQVIGFLNANQEPQYGIERTFDSQLRGQAGLISTVNGAQHDQIIRPDQTIIDPKDGDSIVLTLDRAIQKEVEKDLGAAVKKYSADSGQAIVMDPFTGRVLAMANAPLFDSNNYADVYQKEPVNLDADTEKRVVVDIYDPQTNARIVRAYLGDNIFTASGRTIIENPKIRKQLDDLSQLYDLHSLARYYWYVTPNIIREVFPTGQNGVWLKYKNDLGLGAYLNRTVQEIYEPGSVFKPLIMSIAIDQGEVVPTDTYLDKDPVQTDVNQFIYNDAHKFYGLVTMTKCLEFSINTCMTSVAFKLGPKLLHQELDRFGFGRITGIELEDELPGYLPPWTDFRRKANLATAGFGQGIAATPIQIITAWSALANGGKLLRPTIIDSVLHADGTVEKTEPRLVEQVITPRSSQTITQMLEASADFGFAHKGKVEHYRIAAKTGTSQIAGPNGKYETGTGTTTATFAGYDVPPDGHPHFVILVKLDRPKTGGVEGATVAAPIFKQIASFLFQYYGLPPDDEK